MDSYMGTIMAWAPNYEPPGWMFCDGRLLPLSQYQALHALLGTTYGGDGRNNFALPDLRGRVPLGTGSNPQGSTYSLGNMGGQEAVALTVSNMPTHNHPIPARNTIGNTGTPAANACLAKVQDAQRTEIPVYSTAASNAYMSPTGDVGANQPHGNMQPYAVLNYIICVQGIFPPRQ